MRVATGTYTGNGVDDRGITGVGFQPDLVIVNDVDITDFYTGCWRTATIGGDQAFPFQNSPLGADLIQSLDADGFTVGSNNVVNKNTLPYAWIAFKKDDNNDFNYGSFSGNDADDRWITGVGFQPDFIWIKANVDGIFNNHWISSLGGDQTLNSQSLAGGPIFDNIIQAVNADGFQVGNRNDTYQASNRSGGTYYWWAFKQVAGAVKVGSYVGNDANDRSITGVGFQPSFIIISDVSAVRSTTTRYGVAGDLSGSVNGDWSADRVQAFEADGFQLGTEARVNKNGETFHYLALKDNPAVAGGSFLLNFV